MPINKRKNSTFVMKMTCAILFLSFTFVYLYFYQADVLAVTQHILSKGKTSYNNTIGSVIITIVLYLLQILVARLTKLTKRAYSFTYFPSLLILTVLTDFGTHSDINFSFGVWTWLFPLLILVYIGIVSLLHKLQQYEPETDLFGLFSKVLWLNILSLSIMFLFVGLFSSNDEMFHYRMRAERFLIEGNYDGVLDMHVNTNKTDSSYTMIRAYALSRRGLLAEKLFDKPITASSRALLPNGNDVKLLMYPQSNIFNFIGIEFKQNMSAMTYLNLVEKRHKAKIPVKDYLLCAYLMDKKLDAFVATIRKFYDLDDSHLPKHYREALTLYTHLRTNPAIIYHSTVMDTDFQDFQEMERLNHNINKRKNILHDTYGNTYWYYYLYVGDKK